MALQPVPICFVCREKVSAADAVFEAPCGHEDHPSSVFHGLCLMDFREDRERVFNILRKHAEEFAEVMERLGFESDDG